MVTLAAGVGSRWTQGAGVVKGVASISQVWRCASHLLGSAPGQESQSCRALRSRANDVFTTGYMTEALFARLCQRAICRPRGGSNGSQRGVAHGANLARFALRLGRDATNVLDEQQEKSRQSGRNALRQWAANCAKPATIAIIYQAMFASRRALVRNPQHAAERCVG